MPVRIYKPTSAARRGSSVQDFSDITRKSPQKKLRRRIKKYGGRNHKGITTSRFRGGGARKLYRQVDFKRDKLEVPAKVAAIEYDPNRNCRVALLHYLDGEKRYILCPEGIKVGQVLVSGDHVEPKPGNSMILKNIPQGMDVHNIEMHVGRGGQLVRSAGGSARLAAKETKTAVLIMPSGEMRRVNINCRATIGKVGNSDYQNIRWGKAGRTRHKGRKPHNRGTSQNPVDHPMGGGEGRSGGGRHPCSPTGKPSKGGRTRKRRNPTNGNIIRRRRSRRYGQLKIG
ncbi:MAG: 50S ribosomal protein L2 [Anaerolineaceae bacterium]|nr:50S ribosomal protein L2 [Anaerolineaceae bacterium]